MLFAQQSPPIVAIVIRGMRNNGERAETRGALARRPRGIRIGVGST